MDTILDMKKVFLYYVCFCLLPKDVAWGNIFLLFMSGNCIGILFWENGAGHAIMDAIYL